MLGLLAVLLVAAPQGLVGGQPSLRAPLFGLVKGHDSKPWVAARVRLLSRPVRVESDDRAPLEITLAGRELPLD